MHTTSVSQIFRGEKDLTLEQAANFSTYWGLAPEESDYFVSLVELARAESASLKKILRGRLKNLKTQSQQLSHRIQKDRVLTDVDKFQFYSEWHFSAIRLLSEIPEFSNSHALAAHLRLPLSTVKNAVDFLTDVGLMFAKGGKLSIGPSRTFLEAGSPLISRHHANWRLKAIEKYPTLKNDTDLAVTAPMTISKDDAAKVRERLLESLQDILAINTVSPPEQLQILNIDWLAV